MMLRSTAQQPNGPPRAHISSHGPPATHPQNALYFQVASCERYGHSGCGLSVPVTSVLENLGNVTTEIIQSVPLILPALYFPGTW